MEALRGSEPLTKLGALEKGLFLDRFCEADLSDLARSEARNEILIYIHQSNSGRSSWFFLCVGCELTRQMSRFRIV